MTIAPLKLDPVALAGDFPAGFLLFTISTFYLKESNFAIQDPDWLFKQVQTVPLIFSIAFAYVFGFGCPICCYNFMFVPSKSSQGYVSHFALETDSSFATFC